MHVKQRLCKKMSKKVRWAYNSQSFEVLHNGWVNQIAIWSTTVHCRPTKVVYPLLVCNRTLQPYSPRYPHRKQYHSHSPVPSKPSFTASHQRLPSWPSFGVGQFHLLSAWVALTHPLHSSTNSPTADPITARQQHSLSTPAEPPSLPSC